jgi:hypothetical protein
VILNWVTEVHVIYLKVNWSKIVSYLGSKTFPLDFLAIKNSCRGQQVVRQTTYGPFI